MNLTYYTIIGKDLGLFKWHHKSVVDAGLYDCHGSDSEFLAIVYRNPGIDPGVTDSILDYCRENDVSTFVYDEEHPDFLNNLYKCWNLGYECAKNHWVFRGGSDQAFNKGAFPALYKALLSCNERTVLQANTVECASRIAQIGAVSRHFTMDFGDHWSNFDATAFEEFVQYVSAKTDLAVLDIYQALNAWQRPTSLGTTFGQVQRCDGCSWLMSKDDYKEFGPLPAIESGVTGDVVVHDRMQRAGVVQKIVRDCCTYHLVQGERT